MFTKTFVSSRLGLGSSNLSAGDCPQTKKASRLLLSARPTLPRGDRHLWRYRSTHGPTHTSIDLHQSGRLASTFSPWAVIQRTPLTMSTTNHANRLTMRWSERRTAVRSTL